MYNIFIRHLLQTNRLNAPILKKHLYTPASFGIDAFKKSRNNHMCLMNDLKEYKKDIRDYLESGNSNMILSDDVKKLIKVADTDEDINLLRKIITRLSKQTEVLQYQRFFFGPEIMKLFYVLKRPEDAFSFIQDEELKPLWNQVSTYIILINMLYVNKMYNEVLEAFDIFVERFALRRTLSAPIATLFFAACYKLNTPESFNKAKEVWQELMNLGYKWPYRVAWFFKMLAFNQNELTLAVEAGYHREDSVGTCIKLMSFTKDKRYHDVLYTLKAFQYPETVPLFKRFLTADTVEHLTQGFREAEEEQRSALANALQSFTNHNMIIQETLDDLLCEEIEVKHTNRIEKS